MSVQGKLQEAEVLYQKSLDVRRELVTRDDSNASWKRDLTVSLNRMGDLRLSEGRKEEAEEY